MFERFTEEARYVIVAANEEAHALDHRWITTGHILLGLIRGEGVAATTLAALGVDAEAVRDGVRDEIGSETGDEQVPSRGSSMTPRSRKVLELALREALALGSHNIGTEHILLGITRDSGGVANLVLTRLGVEPQRLRDEVVLRIPPPSKRRARPGMWSRTWSQIAPPTPPRWEYRVEPAIVDPGTLVETLNAFGDESWELVSVLPPEHGGGLVLKRRAPPPREPRGPSPDPEP